VCLFYPPRAGDRNPFACFNKADVTKGGSRPACPPKYEKHCLAPELHAGPHCAGHLDSSLPALRIPADRRCTPSRKPPGWRPRKGSPRVGCRGGNPEVRLPDGGPLVSLLAPSIWSSSCTATEGLHPRPSPSAALYPLVQPESTTRTTPQRVVTNLCLGPPRRLRPPV